eukprot:492165-Rhodomonas_salina.1
MSSRPVQKKQNKPVQKTKKTVSAEDPYLKFLREKGLKDGTLARDLFAEYERKLSGRTTPDFFDLSPNSSWNPPERLWVRDSLWGLRDPWRDA